MKLAGKLKRAGCAGKRDGAVLQRLTEHLQRIPAELRQLVQKEHAAMGEAHLARPRP